MKASELRMSILQMAVQGKLVRQDLHDEPASELLERIYKEKSQLTREGKVKNEKPLPPITEADIPFDLPEGWVWCRFGNAVTVKSSIRIFKSDYVSEGIPFYRSKEIGDLSRGEEIKTKYYISQKKYDEIKTNYGVPRNGDILITSVGTIGNCWISDGRDFYYKDGNITQLINTNNILSDFLLLFLKSPFFYEQAIGTVSGTAYKALTIIKLNHLLFPLPSLAEQKRIIDKVDELMALCDELEAAENKLETLEKHFIEYLPKSILQSAVQGKLVQQGLHDEPASELLKRIQMEKVQLIKEGKIKKEKPLSLIAEDEAPYDLPEGWVWCRIKDICIINPRNTLNDDIEVSFVPMALISSDYFGGHTHEKRLWGKVKKNFTHFAEGDIAIAKITPCFQNGKSCIMRNLQNGYGAGTTELHVLRCIGVLPEYVLIFAKHPALLIEGEKNMTGTAGQQRITTDYLSNYLFPLPPFAEQQRIATKVDELMLLCNELKKAKNDPVLHLSVSPIIRFHKVQDEESLFMVAQGTPSQEQSEELRQAIDDLFGDEEDD